jgi:hypothetical protein
VELYTIKPNHLTKFNRIGGVIDSVLISSAVDLGFEPQLGQTKDCCDFFRLFTEKLTSEFLFQEMREAELYTKLERWPEANAAYKKLLKEK